MSVKSRRPKDSARLRLCEAVGSASVKQLDCLRHKAGGGARSRTGDQALIRGLTRLPHSPRGGCRSRIWKDGTGRIGPCALPLTTLVSSFSPVYAPRSQRSALSCSRAPRLLRPRVCSRGGLPAPCTAARHCADRRLSLLPGMSRTTLRSGSPPVMEPGVGGAPDGGCCTPIMSRAL